MLDAFELHVLDWRPAGLRDIDDLPERTLQDFYAMRSGANARAEPWGWFRTGDPRIASLAHLFRVGHDGPEELARCGAERELTPYRREDVGPLCQRCEAIKAGRQTSIGTIGDLEAEEGRA
jgi:hypothetical protein